MMRRALPAATRTALAGLCLALLASPGLAATPAPEHPQERPRIAAPGYDGVRISTGQRQARAAGSSPDTLYLYGGPGSSEGRFGTVGAPSLDGWTGLDNTQEPERWQVSDFHAANLGGHGAGNLAAWLGSSAAQEPGWAAAPGYGNNWNSSLLFESPPLADPSVGQVVDLDFFLNLDSEPGYDNLFVEYDSAGTWVEVYQGNGYRGDSAGVFLPPGATFDELAQGTIAFAGNDYGGPGGDQVRIRLRGDSDGAWSDQDGLWPTEGMAQVDDISVVWSEGSSFHGFEDGTLGPWRNEVAPFAGDFAKAFQWVWDFDPCVDHGGSVAGFIDDGTPPSNAPGQSTGGTTSLTWSYGGYNGWVVNYNGGLTAGLSGPDRAPLNNELHSPPIAWDLPGTADDDPAWAGAVYRFNWWRHLTLSNGLFFVWHVRTSQDGAASWNGWLDRNFVYYGAAGDWQTWAIGVGDLIPAGTTHVQLAFGVVDLAALFAFPGSDATPSPLVDDVSLAKVRIGGPSIVARERQLLQDSFPQSGLRDAGSAGARDRLDIRLDMAQDVSTGALIIPGDSVVVDVVPVIPGSAVDRADIRLDWVLDRNPLFDDVRTLPAGATSHPGAGPGGVDQWRGSVVADDATTSAGAPVANRYFFSLPDAGFFHPGDVLRYGLVATDDAGRTTTMPADLAGLASGEGHHPIFTVRGLPTLHDAAGAQPPMLVVNAYQRGALDLAYSHLLGEAGLVAGVDYDLYVEQASHDGVSNGIGSGGHHGATATQLEGYSTLLYLAGTYSARILSNGTDTGNNSKADDIGLLTAWHQQPAPRTAVYFGDGLLGSLAADGGTSGNSFLQNILAVIVNDDNASDELGGLANPRVVPAAPGLALGGIAYGGCDLRSRNSNAWANDDLGLQVWGLSTPHRFDSIVPHGGAVAGHHFLDAQGNPYADPVASVLHDRLVDGHRKVDLSFPFGILAFRGDINGGPAGASGVSHRAALLRELLDVYTGVGGGAPTPVLPDAPGLARLQVAPNPFNPRTELSFTTGRAGHVELALYDLRGRQLRSVALGELAAGPQRLSLDGTDDTGAPLASGVYLLRVRLDDREELRQRVVLLK